MKTLKLSMILAVGVLFVSMSGNAQPGFRHSLGVTYYSYFNASSFGLMYSPRIQLFQTGKESNISLGSHLSGGLAWHSFEGGMNYYFDVPLMLEYHFGHGSEPSTRSKTGGFFGVGGGYNTIGDGNVWNVDKYQATGIVVNAGLRRNILGRPMGARISYMYNFNEADYRIIGFGLFFFFGEL